MSTRTNVLIEVVHAITITLGSQLSMWRLLPQEKSRSDVSHAALFCVEVCLKPAHFLTDYCNNAV